MLEVTNLHVSVKRKNILKGISLSIKPKEIHALMGPNGSGKSTLAFTLMGHPKYKLKVKSAKCKICLDGKNIIDKRPDQRAKSGLFLAFQNPLTVSGVSVANFLKVTYRSTNKNNKKFSVMDFNKMLVKKAEGLRLKKKFLRRSLNDGFSGGEKKKTEMLQTLMLEPKYVIFDEIDTGLDIDALKTVAGCIRELSRQGAGVLLITHYQRILHHVKPDYVHMMIEGKIVKSGDYRLAIEIEKKGYRQ